MKIPVSHGQLEAALRDPEGDPPAGAVVCHPHPIHGGTMHTKGVYRASRALNQAGLRTLRFNFRGVGLSTGTFDEGIGEEEDVKAALDWLALGLPDRPLVVGGMSFGSMVGLKVGVSDPRVAALLAIGVPVNAYDYGYLAETQKPVLVVQGDEDEFGSGTEVRETMSKWGEHVTVKTVAGSGHLFEGYLDQLQTHILEFFTSGPGQAALKKSAEGKRGRS